MRFEECDFFESMLLYKGFMPLVDKHFERIERTANQFQLTLNFNFEQFNLEIAQAISSQKLLTAKLRAIFKIEYQSLNYIEIQAEAMDENLIFPIQATSLCIYQDGVKEVDSISNCKSYNALIYQDAVKYALNNHCEQAIVLNSNQEIVETTACNIFLIKDQKIYTPHLPSGAVGGILRGYIIKEFNVYETTISIQDLNSYDEVFLTNAVRGVIIVDKIVGKTFGAKMAKDVQEKIRSQILD